MNSALQQSQPAALNTDFKKKCSKLNVTILSKILCHPTVLNLHNHLNFLNAKLDLTIFLLLL